MKSERAVMIGKFTLKGLHVLMAGCMTWVGYAVLPNTWPTWELGLVVVLWSGWCACALGMFFGRARWYPPVATVVKALLKIIHVLGVGLIYCLWNVFSVSASVWNLILIAAGFGWLVCAVGLLFKRRWAWWGNVVSCGLGLGYAAYYWAVLCGIWVPGGMGNDEYGIGAAVVAQLSSIILPYFVLCWITPCAMLLAFLLATRCDYRRSAAPADSQPIAALTSPAKSRRPWVVATSAVGILVCLLLVAWWRGLHQPADAGVVKVEHFERHDTNQPVAAKAVVLITPLTGIPQERMPNPADDVLWVSSIPLGAQVFVFPKEKGQLFPPDNDTNITMNPQSPHMVIQYDYAIEGPLATQHKIGPFSNAPLGKTPLAVRVPPGVYGVAVQLDVAAEQLKCEPDDQPIGTTHYLNLGHERLGGGGLGAGFAPFLNDGNLEAWMLCATGKIQKIGKIYEVEKSPGAAATTIALFQRADQDIVKLYATLPKNYRFRTAGLAPQMLVNRGLPLAKAKQLCEAFARGGKILHYTETAAFLYELLPSGMNTQQFSIQSGK